MPMTTVHYQFSDLGISPMDTPDCKSVYIVQDAYTRQFYPDNHEKFLSVATQAFKNEVDLHSFTRNHGVIDTLTATVALTYDTQDCPMSERKQFDKLVSKELVRMLIKGDRK